MDDSLPPSWRALISSSPNQEYEDILPSHQPRGQCLSGIEPSADPGVSDECRSVNISSDQYEELLSRLSKLEESVASLESERSTPERAANATRALRSARKGKTADRDRRSSEFHEVVLADFQRVCLGGRTGARDVDNAQQACSHAKRFCCFMLGGLASPGGQRDLLFLNDKEKLCSYPKHLEGQGYTPTTVKHMLCNVSKFLRHVQTSHLTSSQLSEEQLSALLRDLKTLQGGVSREAAVHRVRVAGKVKAENAPAPSAAVDPDFKEVARRRIPELLRFVKKRRGVVRLHDLLMGYVVGYLAGTSGHGPAVLTCATKEDVACAEVFADGTGFKILVNKQEEADGAGGLASFQLNREEYGWLDCLTNISCCSGTSSCRFVFHSVDGTQLCRPGSVLQEAWLDAGLKGAASFSGIQATSTDAEAGPQAVPVSSHDIGDKEDAPEAGSGNGADDRAEWAGESLLSNVGDVSQDLFFLPSHSVTADSSSSEQEDESFTFKRKSVDDTDNQKSGVKKCNKTGAHPVYTRPPLSSRWQSPASSAGLQSVAALPALQKRASSATRPHPASVSRWGNTGVPAADSFVANKESAAVAGKTHPPNFSARHKPPPSTAGRKDTEALAGKKHTLWSSWSLKPHTATAVREDTAALEGKQNTSRFSGWQKQSGPAGRPNWVRVLPPAKPSPSDSSSESG